MAGTLIRVLIMANLANSIQNTIAGLLLISSRNRIDVYSDSTNEPISKL
jgi:hypothetical protein